MFIVLALTPLLNSILPPQFQHKTSDATLIPSESLRLQHSKDGRLTREEKIFLLVFCPEIRFFQHVLSSFPYPQNLWSTQEGKILWCIRALASANTDRHESPDSKCKYIKYKISPVVLRAPTCDTDVLNLTQTQSGASSTLQDPNMKNTQFKPHRHRSATRTKMLTFQTSILRSLKRWEESNAFAIRMTLRTSNPVLLFARVLLAERHQGPFQERIPCIGNAVEFVDLSTSQFSSDQSLS